jgi:hypothetical protein
MNVGQAFRRRDGVEVDWRAILVFSPAESLPAPIRQDFGRPLCLFGFEFESAETTS